MASVTKLSFLLTLLVSTNYADLDIYLLGGNGGSCSIPVLNNRFIIFKNTSEGHIFLWPTSPFPVNSTLLQSMRNRLHLDSTLQISNLTESDSGQYAMRIGSNTWWFRLVVCSVKLSEVTYAVGADLSAELHCEGAGAADNLTVQWFRWKPQWPWGWSKIFSEGNGSLNPLMRDLEGRVHMVENSSSLRISNVTHDDQVTSFSCVVLDGQSCIATHEIKVKKMWEYLYHTVGEQTVLPCLESDSDGKSEKWFKNVIWTVSNNTDERQQMYIVDGRETGNYSLVIPSLTLNHSGLYECRAKYGNTFNLFVCLEPEPQIEFFSAGGEVNLSCNSDLKERRGVVWFIRTARHQGVVLDSLNEDRKLPDDLERRAHLSSSYTRLILSNLSLQDQGEYWCSVYLRDLPTWNMCESTNKIVLIYQEPSDSTLFAVRASLMSCGLLGLVCAVAVTLKTRIREEDPH